MEDDKANPRDNQQPRFPSSSVAMGKRCKTRKNGKGKSSNICAHCSAKHFVREVVDVVCMGEGTNDTSLLVLVTSMRDDGPVVEDSPSEELSLDASEARPADAQSCCTDAEAEGVYVAPIHWAGQAQRTLSMGDVSWNQSLAAYADPAQTDTLICDVVTSSLLESYHEECKLDAAKDPSGVMEATIPPPEAQRKRKRPHTQGALDPNIKRFCKDEDNHWFHHSTTAVVALVHRDSAAAHNSSPPNEPANEDHRTKRRPHVRGKNSVQRGGQFRKVLPNGEPNPAHLAQGLQRIIARSDAVVSTKFSLLHHASHSKSGFQGAPPPLKARNKIRDLFFQLPSGKALFPYLKHFFPVEYYHHPNPRQERATFLVYRDGQVFFFRGFRAHWLKDCASEFEEAIRILIADDDKDAKFKASCANLRRVRQFSLSMRSRLTSEQRPYLTAWHKKHEGRVQKFMDQPIIKRVMGWVANVMRLIFPGITQQMDSDSQWHGLKPPFAWNICLNALFEGQRSVLTPPHADSKNQVLVCLMLVYVLKSGVRCNDTQRIWLWLWEVNVAIQLPAWTLAAYPSGLFYHFNLDIHTIKFVTTEDDERPTLENSRPIELGDGDGRGSLDGRAHGHSGTVDYGDCIQMVFEKALVLTPVPQDIIETLSS
ncbi:hypothetical protein B0H10DRAFT_1947491 [Mycena sp. CBHHK59/15]|nr:hypothetical protein B0H10DRAFT_1947491 [Mycena sp. CBHHK59/15]